MNTGLILVDIQKDYFKDGKYELVNSEEAAICAKAILNYFRKRKWPIYHVRHISINQEARFFIPGTPGTDFHKACYPLEQEEVITKHRPDSFFETNLKDKLEEKEIDVLVVCGMMTHMCIDTTVRSANNYGYTVELIEDACATRSLEWHGMTVSSEQVQNAYMAALDGTFAKVYKKDEWMRRQEKEISVSK